MPSYLMLIDGMVEALPDNERLLITATQAYSSYASAFVEEEDKEYAIALYTKARDYAFRALTQIGFKNPISKKIFLTYSGRLPAGGAGSA